MGADQTELPDGASEDAEVVEERDVSDVPEDDVDDMVDEMVAGNDESDSASTDDDGPTHISEADPDEWDVEDFEEQEWTLGEEKEDEVHNFKGTRFLFSEPEDDEILNIIAQQPGEQVDPKENMFDLCEAVIKAPTLTRERWEDGMNTSERIGLAMRVSQYIGIQDFMDFPEAGAEAQQAW